MDKIFHIALLLFSVFISAISQVILKKAAEKKYSSKIREYLNAPVVLAYSIFVAATFLTIFSYRVVPLSLGAVLETTSYLYVTAFGVLIFKEKVTPKRLIALAFIISGVIISAIFG